MTAIDKYCLNWNGFETSATNTLKSLHYDRHFTNVTLVSEDDQQIEAHKVILSSASPFFQKILLKNPHPHPLIYLRGLKLEEMKAIVDFIYLGQTEVNSQDVECFLQVAKDLKVRGLQGGQENNENVDNEKKVLPSKDDNEAASIVEDDEVEVKDDVVKNEDDVVEDDVVEDNYDPYVKANNILTEQNNDSLKKVNKITEPNEEGQYPCDGCDYKAKRSDHLKRHKIRKHSNINESESKEALEDTYRGLTEILQAVQYPKVKIEIDNMAKEIYSNPEDSSKKQYPCDVCGYKAGRSDHLKRHKLRVHTSLPAGHWQI